MIKKTCLAFVLASSGSVVLANLPAPSVCRAVAVWDFSNSILQTYGTGPAEISPGENVGPAANEWWITRTPRAARSGWWPSIGGDHTTNNNDTDSKFLLISTVSQGDGQLLYSKNITNLSIGKEYTVTVWLSNTYIGYLTKVSVELPDGNGGHLAPPELSIQPPLTDNQSPQLPWKSVSMTFTAISDTQPIQIINRQNRGEGGAGNSGDDIAIDDISITTLDCAVAPPSSAQAVPAIGAYGLTLLAGLMGAGAFLRRRKTQQKNAL